MVTSRVSESEKVLIFDYSVIAYQAFYSNEISPHGRFIDLVVNCIESVVDPGDIYSIVFAMDDIPIRKLKINQDYKGNRKRDSNDPKSLLLECLDVIKCTRMSSYGEEADDVIASICQIVKKKDKFIFSTDSDLISILDSRTTLVSPRDFSKTTELSLIMTDSVSSSENSIIKIFAGDYTNNIKSVRKNFGTTKIRKLVKQYSIDEGSDLSIETFYSYLISLGLLNDGDRVIIESNKELVLLKNDILLSSSRSNATESIKRIISYKPDNLLKYRLLGLSPSGYTTKQSR